MLRILYILKQLLILLQVSVDSGEYLTHRSAFFSHAQVLMNKLWFNTNLSEAVDKPRLHTQLVPDQDVSYEKIPFDSSGKYSMSDDIIKGLKELGHNVTGSKSFAVVQAVYRDPKSKDIYAKSDPRKHGAPAGQ